MGKTHEYFQQELGLDEKTSEAIKILMDEGLLEPLLIDLRSDGHLYGHLIILF